MTIKKYHIDKLQNKKECKQCDNKVCNCNEIIHKLKNIPQLTENTTNLREYLEWN